MRTPAWAESPAFAPCWAATQVTRKTAPFKETRAVAERVLNGLGRAHVVAITPEQLDAIPVRDRADMEDTPLVWPAEVRLPFPTTFLDLWGADLPTFDAPRPATAGVLVEEMNLSPKEGYHDFSLGGYVWVRFPIGPPLSFYPWPFYVDEEHRVVVGFINGDPSVERLRSAPDPDGLFDSALESVASTIIDNVERSLSFLDLLSSVNVDLREAPLPRKRKLKPGQNVALVVQIREPKHSASRGGSIDYSHRFEVRGSWHHIRRGPKFEAAIAKSPEKLREDSEGPHFLEWHPPHVKGPVDKPLIPKIRVMAPSS